MRNFDAGEEAIEDSATRELLEGVARKIHISALLTAFTLTLLVFVFLK